MYNANAKLKIKAKKYIYYNKNYQGKEWEISSQKNIKTKYKEDQGIEHWIIHIWKIKIEYIHPQNIKNQELIPVLQLPLSIGHRLSSSRSVGNMKRRYLIKVYLILLIANIMHQ